MRVEQLEDGTILRYKRSLQDVPFFGDWLKLLLTRCVAHVTSKHTLAEDGRPELGIVARDRFQEANGSVIEEDGTVKIVCIGCGKHCSKLDMARIIIGGTIQLRQEQEIGPKEISISYQRRPTSRRGLGCPDCQRKMQEATEAINRTNADRQRMYEAAMELENAKRLIAKELGGSHVPKDIKQPAMLTPYIDLTEEMLKLSEMEIRR